jgi:hypothetical protein
MNDHIDREEHEEREDETYQVIHWRTSPWTDIMVCVFFAVNNPS